MTYKSFRIIGLSIFIIFLAEMAQAEKLNMTLYYESLCPFCGDFIKKEVFPVWRKINGEKYLNIDFVPYGNAKTIMHFDRTFNITCQHGEDECKANILHNCALKYIPTQTLQLAFIYCTLQLPEPYKAGSQCAHILRIDFRSIKTCVDGDEGKYLHWIAGSRTNSLRPPHEGVPWIIFNNVMDRNEMLEARTDFLRFVCKKLKTVKPPLCAIYVGAV